MLHCLFWKGIIRVNGRLTISGSVPFLSTVFQIYACMMVFFFSNMIENQMMSTGAFEITLNGEPLFGGTVFLYTTFLFPLPFYWMDQFLVFLSANHLFYVVQEKVFYSLWGKGSVTHDYQPSLNWARSKLGSRGVFYRLLISLSPLKPYCY